MEKMLFTTSGIGRLRMTVTEIFKIDDVFLDSSQIMTVPAKYRPASEEILKETVEMTLKRAVSTVAITGMALVPIGKIMVQGSRGRIYLPKIC
jgi:hypothetical protein